MPGARQASQVGEGDIYVLRQASRRSWRIGQRLPVEVKFLHYAGTMQQTCLRLMGKKLLVSLAMEGKFSSEGLQAIEDGEDILMAMARIEVWRLVLVEKQGSVVVAGKRSRVTTTAQRFLGIPKFDRHPRVYAFAELLLNTTSVD